MTTIEHIPWCTQFNHAIDNDLVNKAKPICIELMNGCGNCPKSTMKLFIDGKESIPETQ